MVLFSESETYSWTSVVLIHNNKKNFLVNPIHKLQSVQFQCIVFIYFYFKWIRNIQLDQCNHPDSITNDSYETVIFIESEIYSMTSVFLIH